MTSGRKNWGSLLVAGGLITGLWFLFANLGGVLQSRFPNPLPSKEVIIAEIEEPVQEGPTPLRSQTSISIEPLPLITSADFSVPAALEAAVDFWRKIYAVYDSDQVVLHDAEDLSVIYGVIDLKDLNNLPEKEKMKSRESRVLEATRLLQERLDEEHADRVRSQTGLKDKFIQAVRVSGRYLPLFEEIFVSYGVPQEITRLVFVESMFQERARSKVGAGGLWQFLPGTARRFIKVDHWIDERYDPIVSTHAAARLLLKNMEEVGSWPLAITSYNTGTGHVKKAVHTVGTTDIGTIIKRYRSDGFGFASRNFYPSFLAAYHVYENRERYFGSLEKEPVLEFDQVTLPVSVTFLQVAELSGSSLLEIQFLNPAYESRVFLEGMKLPVGAKIRVPKGRTLANLN
ncbi:MAG: transglycosylase SLT domain-containing protein [Deltaproteobacteria bacterium]|nr:transglycosylase SLT domain-containing protein [Deltaproteobacteria bacterium]